MFEVVLYEPEIPPNTGNIIRLCANTGARLHLVEPLGFDIGDRNLRRAGLDYHEYAQMQLHASFEACRSAIGNVEMFAFSARARTPLSRVRFDPGCALLFGPETRGLPAEVMSGLDEAHRIRLPMVADSRSLNLSNAVAVAVYEAWRQHDYAGAQGRLPV